MKVLPYGEDGTYVDLEAPAPEQRADRTLALASALRARLPAADVVCGAGVVAVFGAPFEDVRASIAASTPGTASGDDVDTSPEPTSTHQIDTVYDGPDLDALAAALGVDRAAVIDLHAGRPYTVEVVGFLPGFAYMGPLDPRLVLPRRTSPRPRVDPQTVAVAGSFTGIYPQASPGGWNLLGRNVGPPPFDAARPRPFLFAPGDRVCFRPVSSRAAATPPASAPATPPPDVYTPPAGAYAGPALVVARPPGPATLQDAGRRGLLGRGMPPSGPLDPPLFAASNRAAGNPPHAAAIELLAGPLELVARGSVTVSIDGAPAQLLRDGDVLRVAEGQGAVRYVALTGGIDVPEVVGARATLLTARIGGVEGRLLRRGDVLRPGSLSLLDAGPLHTPPRDTAAAPAPLLVDPGPHLDRFPAAALDTLLATEWRLSRLTDRTGARLEAGTIPRTGPDLAAPVPMRRGAVQVTTDGTPIVLGPDHPTTGGYPVLAVVRSASFATLAQKRPGDLVRFRLAAV